MASSPHDTRTGNCLAPAPPRPRGQGWTEERARGRVHSQLMSVSEETEIVHFLSLRRPGKCFTEQKTSIGDPGKTSSPASPTPLTLPCQIFIILTEIRQWGRQTESTSLPTQNRVVRTLNEERSVNLGGGVGIGAGGGVLFMKNKIIKFRSVEGGTGLKQIWGPGKDSKRQRNERYVCFKAGLSILGGSGSVAPVPPQKACMYTNIMTHSLAGR